MHTGTVTGTARSKVSDRWPDPPDMKPRVPPREVPDVPERTPTPPREVPVEPTEIPRPAPLEVPEPEEDVAR